MNTISLSLVSRWFRQGVEDYLDHDFPNEQNNRYPNNTLAGRCWLEGYRLSQARRWTSQSETEKHHVMVVFLEPFSVLHDFNCAELL